MKVELCDKMKPLPVPESTESRHRTANLKKMLGKRFQLVGILKPEENSQKCTDWVLVVTANGSHHGLEYTKDIYGEDSNALILPTNERQKLLCHLSAMKTISKKNGIYIGNYLICNQADGTPVKINGTGEKSGSSSLFAITMSKDVHRDMLQNQTCKLIGRDPVANCSVYLVPVAVFGTDNLASVQWLRKYLGPKERRLTADRFPLQIFSRKQWKSFMSCLASFQEKFWMKTKATEAGDASQGRGFLKWIRRGVDERGKQRRTVRSVQGLDGESDEENDSGEELENRSRIQKSGIKKKQRKLKYNQDGTPCKGDQKRGKKVGYGDKETKQLVRIELKPDPNIQESSFKFCSGDWLRLKVTIFEDLRKMKDFLRNDFAASEYEMEIDFVQNIMCETDGFDGCRCRRITKLLERAVVRDLKWERGVHISGQQFALCWIPYRIPVIFDSNASQKCLLMDSLDNKFKVAASQYEMQIRLYGLDDDKASRLVLSACMFPLSIMAMEMETGVGMNGGRNSAWLESGGDILQVFQEQEFDQVEMEAQNTGQMQNPCFIVATTDVSIPTEVSKIIESATEFDV